MLTRPLPNLRNETLIAELDERRHDVRRVCVCHRDDGRPVTELGDAAANIVERDVTTHGPIVRVIHSRFGNVSLQAFRPTIIRTDRIPARPIDSSAWSDSPWFGLVSWRWPATDLTPL